MTTIQAESPAVIADSPLITRRSRTCSTSSLSSLGSGRSSPSKGKSQRKSSSLPTETVEYLKAWMMSPEHVAHPYPTEQEKAQIMADTGIELKQLTNWFVNNRKRYWKPRVEARLQNQVQAQAAAAAVAAVTAQVVPSSSSSSSSRSTVEERFGSPSSNAPYLALDMTQPPSTNLHPFFSSGAESSQTMVSSVPTGNPHTVSDASSSTSESDLSNDLDDDLHSMKTGIIIKPIKSITVTNASRAIKTSAFTSTTRAPAPSTLAKPQQEEPKLKRKRSDDVTHVNRTKFLKESPTMWREACVEANHAYDDALPSLEEAAHLFGYCIQSS